MGVGTISVKLTDRVSTAGTSVSVEYQQGGELSLTAPTSVTVSTTVGVATTAGVIDSAFDSSITGIVTTGIAVNDVITVAGGNSTVPVGTKVAGIGVSTIFVDRTITGISTAGDGAVFTFTRGCLLYTSDAADE